MAQHFRLVNDYNWPKSETGIVILLPVLLDEFVRNWRFRFADIAGQPWIRWWVNTPGTICWVMNIIEHPALSNSGFHNFSPIPCLVSIHHRNVHDPVWDQLKPLYYRLRNATKRLKTLFWSIHHPTPWGGFGDISPASTHWCGDCPLGRAMEAISQDGDLAASTF